MNRKAVLLRRVRCLTWLFIIGLVVSGVTALPLRWEVDLLARLVGAGDHTSPEASSGLARWILTVRDALRDTDAKYPFMAYGTDWLAFGHFVIAIVFVGALRDPVRNAWLFDFAMIACALVPIYAFAFGAIRGIPIGWRLIDCSFGVIGIIPVWLCRKYVRELGGFTDCPTLAR